MYPSADIHTAADQGWPLYLCCFVSINKSHTCRSKLIFPSSISSTMMSRLMLNLHETADIGILSADYEKGVLSTQITVGGTLDSSLIDSQWERSSTAIEGRSPYGQFEPGSPTILQSATSVPD